MATKNSNTSSMNSRNALITKIALFLNYLSKENFQEITNDVGAYRKLGQINIFKIMQLKKYIRPKDVPRLKKACVSFAKVHTDTRFRSLRLNFEFITDSNLKLALDEQKNITDSGEVIFLGDLLVDAGMISDRQRKLILQKQKLEGGVR
jgi:hypothetical protein